MRCIRAAAAMFLLSVSGLGCATSPSQSTDLWVNAHGGLLPTQTAAQARIARIATPLTAACKGRATTVNVLATDAVTAYSLRDGHIFVTRGLMDHLSDAELQA